MHSFRFFGLVFIIPGVVGPNLPVDFAEFAAYNDFATGVLAMLALLSMRIRSLFWLLVVAFNLVGAADILIDYYHGIQLDLPALSGQLVATYWIPILYVPILVITHFAAFYLLSARASSFPHRRCGRILNRIRPATWVLNALRHSRGSRDQLTVFFRSNRREAVVGL